jgi:acyl-lipid omega-6 desaturase (Delta-12 desaturase)
MSDLETPTMNVVDSPDFSPAPTEEPPTPQVRSGAELIKASSAFEGENRWTSWRLLTTTLLAYAVGLAAIWLSPWWPIKVLSGAITGLVLVRIFIFFHDAMHGAIFRKSPVGQMVMRLVGFHLLAVPSVWKETHNYHHQNNAKLASSFIGSYPMLTIGMKGKVTKSQWRQYRMVRHGLTMAAGMVTVFLIGMVWSAFRRDPKQHWGGPVATVIQIGIFIAIGMTLGWMNAVYLQVIPAAVAMAVGSYLFYAQHNFPDMKLYRRRDWTFTNAAIDSSSMFDMGPVMHWFTGNIGYHHVHHLNHRIPFYRLPEAMAGLPEMQNPGRTTWRLRDIRACLALGVWDPDANHMLTWREAAAVKPGEAIQAEAPAA